MSRTGFARILILALWCINLLFSQQANPAGALDDAAAAFEQGRVAEADQTLNSFLKNHPADLRALILKGAVLDTLQRWNEAESYHQRALTLAPGSVQVLNNVANHYLASGNVHRAREFYVKAIAIDPHHPNANLQLAQMCVDEKKGGLALQYLNQLSGADSTDPAILLLRLRALALDGQCSNIGWQLDQLKGQLKLGSNLDFSIGAVFADCKLYDRAEESFSRALDADPKDFDILYNLGLAALEAGHTSRATKVLETALKQRPDDPDCLFALSRSYDTARRERGFALARAHEYKSALSDLDWYVSKHPRDAMGLYELSVAQAFEDRGKALQSLDQALAIDPAFIQARYSRALLNIEEEKPAAAIEDLRFFLERKPEDTRALLQLGNAYLAVDRAEDAAGAFKRALELAPGDPSIQMRYRTALLKLGRTQEAGLLLIRLKQTDDRKTGEWRDDREVLLARAVALAVMPRDEDALKLLAKMQAEWPEWGQPYLVNGIILETQRRSSEALQILETAIALGAATPQAFYYQALAITHDAPTDLESAQTAIEHALALTSTDPYMLLLAGRISLARKQFPAAIDRLAQATDLLPALIPAHYALHDAYLAIGDERKAAAELDAVQHIADQNAAPEKSPFPAEDFVLKVRPPG